MIEAKNIQLSYGELKVLKGIDLQVSRGDFVSIVGPSGAGKTTLLQILGTLEESQTGSLHINGRDINSLSEKKLAGFRNREIGFVFQSHNLLNEFNALENVCLPAFISGEAKNKAEEKATELLKMLGLAKRLKHRPNQLSGGEQQRVAVARALINSPSIVFADEPSGNLDSNNANELHNLFLKLNKELKQTFVIVTHNKELADCANRRLVMENGKIMK